MSKTQMKKTGGDVSADLVMKDLWAARRTLALIAAIDLDLFSVIANGKTTASAVAAAVKSPVRGVEHLLDALVGMGYLTKKAAKYGLTPPADAFLVRDRHTYLGAFAEESRMTFPGWIQLSDVIRNGKPLRRVDTAEGREFFPKLVRAIFPMMYGSARRLVDLLPQSRLKQVERVLDVAAGSAAWSLPFAQALPKVRVTAMDYPEVTAVAREYAQRFGVADRYDYLEGNLREVDFGLKQYDIVLLGHIIHVEGESWGKKLIAKCFRALKPGGTLVIAEMVPNDTRTGPEFPLLFGLNMILHTEEGDVFTMAQYKEWLKKAGFTGTRTLDVQGPSPLILATRP
jgi:ubiquinone/menaquinone biosynthesis C-methylase UbiE